MPETLLRAQNLSIAFGGLKAVRDVSLDVPEGSLTALVGPNGAGKTTLFGLLSGFLRPQAGSVQFAGRDITGRPPQDNARLGLTRTFQIVQPFGAQTVRQNIAAGAHLRLRERGAALAAAEDIARRVNLHAMLDKPAADLTVAGRKRLELARALATQPRLLLLDEVLAGLNPSEVDEMIPVVRRLADEGVTILMIEHVMRAVMSLAEHVWVLSQGCLIASGSPREVTSHPAVIEAYLGHGTAMRLAGQGQGQGGRGDQGGPGGVASAGAGQDSAGQDSAGPAAQIVAPATAAAAPSASSTPSAAAADAAAAGSAKAAMDARTPAGSVSQHQGVPAAPPSAAPARPLLEISGLRAGYGRMEVLRGVDLSVGEGEIVVLLGSNGAGKSTLNNTVSGLCRPRGGSVRFGGTDITGRHYREVVRAGLIQVPEGRRVFPNLSVRENLELGSYARAGARRADNLDRVLQAFPRLRERLGQLAGTMSGGEQQMLAIGRGLMAEPRLLILDEPSLGLSPLMVEELFGLIAQLHETGLAILLVEQNVGQSLETGQRAYVMEEGAVRFQGSCAELLACDDVRRAYLGM